MFAFTQFKDSHNFGQIKRAGGLMSLMILMTAACSQPQSFVKNKVDAFTVDTQDSYTQASALLQADYLISVDFSFSMSSGCTYNAYYNCSSPKITRLFDSLDSFTANLAAAGIDYRIGFVRGSKQSTTNVSDTDFISGLALTSSFSGSLTQLIRSRLGAVGQPLQGDVTSVVETSSKVLVNRGSDFLRDSAQLVMVMVTDSDDSAYTNADLAAIAGRKTDPSYISARGVLAGVNSNCYTDPSYPQSYGEAYGTRVAAAVNYLDPSASPKISCIMDNFSSIMNNVARTVTRSTQRFKLQVPNPDASTLKVYKGSSGLVPTTDYNYVAATNEVVFNSGKEPAPSESLKLTYSQNYVLTSRPDVATIQVLVDGSASTAWTYDSTLNRIVFTTNPAEGAKIQVMYKLGTGS